MFSSIDGFRNVNINVANGYIATFNTSQYFTGIPSTTGSNIYLGGTISTGNSDLIFTKLNNNRSASIIVQKELGNVSTTENGYLAALDSSENLYLVGVGTGDSAEVTKFTSSGTLTWQKNITSNIGGGASATYTEVAVEASGSNIYTAGTVTILLTGNVEAIGEIVKYNSSGTILSQNRVSYFNDGANRFYRPTIRDLTVDGTNLYISGTIPLSFDSNISYHEIGSVEKRYSNGVTAWSSGLYDVTNTGNVSFAQSVVDTNGNVFILGSTQLLSQGPDLIAKIYANGTLAWQKSISNTAMTSLTVDSTGNLYLAGRLSPDLANSLYASLDANTGNINWQNFIYSSTGNMDMADINYANNFLYVGGYFNTGSNSGVAMKLPSNGNGIGTHGSFVISSANITTNVSLLTSTTGTFGASTTTYSNSTGNLTLSNGSTTRRIIPL